MTTHKCEGAGASTASFTKPVPAPSLLHRSGTCRQLPSPWHTHPGTERRSPTPFTALPAHSRGPIGAGDPAPRVPAALGAGNTDAQLMGLLQHHHCDHRSRFRCHHRPAGRPAPLSTRVWVRSPVDGVFQSGGQRWEELSEEPQCCLNHGEVWWDLPRPAPPTLTARFNCSGAAPR